MATMSSKTDTKTNQQATRSPWTHFGCLNHPNGGSPPYRTSSEYAQAVRAWVWQYHQWNQMNMMAAMVPYYTMATMNTNASMDRRNNNTTPFEELPRPQARGPPVALVQDFKVPPVWKRIAAEFVDFLLLFLVKLGVTMIVIDYLGYTNLEKYDLDYMVLLSSEDLDPEKIMAMMNELIALEVINRMFVIVFETLCIHRGLLNECGGQTPGKRLLGIKVVLCDHVLEMPNNRVKILPSGNIGLWNAIVRSVIKNFSMAFFFPVCFTVLFFQHKRAAYDLLSCSMVVEDIQQQRPNRR